MPEMLIYWCFSFFPSIALFSFLILLVFIWGDWGLFQSSSFLSALPHICLSKIPLSSYQVFKAVFVFFPTWFLGSTVKNAEPSHKNFFGTTLLASLPLLTMSLSTETVDEWFVLLHGEPIFWEVDEKESERQRGGEIHLGYHGCTSLEVFSGVVRYLVGGGKAAFWPMAYKSALIPRARGKCVCMPAFNPILHMHV